MAEEQIRKRIKLPKNWNDDEYQRAFIIINEIIVNRTKNNISVEGSRFPDYSDSYAKSKDFENAGKSQGDPNLTLSGNMLESIQLLEVGQGYIEIGYEAGDENDKAVWAEREEGVENKKGPARKFLGLQDFELEQVISEINLLRSESDGQETNIIDNLNDTTNQVRDNFINNLIKTTLPDEED